MSTFREFLDEQLQDPEFRAEWDALEPEFAIVQAMIDARINSEIIKKKIRKENKDK